MLVLETHHTLLMTYYGFIFILIMAVVSHQHIAVHLINTWTHKSSDQHLHYAFMCNDNEHH